MDITTTQEQGLMPVRARRSMPGPFVSAGATQRWAWRQTADSAAACALGFAGTLAIHTATGNGTNPDKGYPFGKRPARHLGTRST
jgi:hypothetical protein